MKCRPVASGKSNFDMMAQKYSPRQESSAQVGKGEGHSSPSPLPRWGRFPIFTGEPFSGTGRRRSCCHHGGANRKSLHRGCSDFTQAEQALTTKVFQTHPPIVLDALTLELHAADAHADPPV